MRALKSEPSVSLSTPRERKLSLPGEILEANRPIPIRRILQDDVKPPKEEYIQLKDLDTRFHLLKFSRDISKTYSGQRHRNNAAVSLNRYFEIKYYKRAIFILTKVN